MLRGQAEVRYPAYQEADVTVETGDDAHHVTVEQIMKALSAHIESAPRRHAPDPVPSAPSSWAWARAAIPCWWAPA